MKAPMIGCQSDIPHPQAGRPCRARLWSRSHSSRCPLQRSALCEHNWVNRAKQTNEEHVTNSSKVHVPDSKAQSKVDKKSASFKLRCVGKKVGRQSSSSPPPPPPPIIIIINIIIIVIVITTIIITIVVITSVRRCHEHHHYCHHFDRMESFCCKNFQPHPLWAAISIILLFLFLFTTLTTTTPSWLSSWPQP